MAHSKQAKKRIRQNDKARVDNKATASRMRTELKRVHAAIAAGDAKAAREALPTAVRTVDKAAKSNVIHPNAASRTKSRLEKAIQRIDG